MTSWDTIECRRSCDVHHSRWADINLANAVIRAPYDGVITQRHTETGAYLNVGDKVVSMTNDASLEVEAEVPSTILGGLPPGTRVKVDPETAPAFDATVRAVVPEENQLTRTRTVRFTPQIDARTLHLAANQSVVLQIPAGPPRMVTTAHKEGTSGCQSNTRKRAQFSANRTSSRRS